MTIKRFITPIKISTKKPKYRASTGLESQKVLESFLKRYYVNVSIVERLHGGVDSDVYSANINQKRVVIKHTEDRSLSLFKPPFSPIDYLYHEKT